MAPPDDDKKFEDVTGEVVADVFGTSGVELDAEPKPEPEPEPEPEPKQPGYDYTQQISQLTAQNTALAQQIGQMQSALSQMQQRPQIPQRAPGSDLPANPKDHPDYPKMEDWAKDPNAAMEKWSAVNNLYQMRAQQYQQEQIRAQQQAQQAASQSVSQAHTETWNDIAQMVPEFAKENTRLRNITAHILKNKPELRQMREGMIYACGAALIAYIKENYASLQAGGGQQPNQQQNVVQMPVREPQRQQAVMTRSGKGAATTSVTLSPEQTEMMEKMNIQDPESYAQALKMLGRTA
jgi:hypothetical protein